LSLSGGQRGIPITTKNLNGKKAYGDSRPNTNTEDKEYEEATVVRTASVDHALLALKVTAADRHNRYGKFEIRNSNDESNSNDQMFKTSNFNFSLSHSSFVILISSFIRH
ncbi:MAG: hypothetical protein V1723_05015, partial [Candidatus Uhrbacteria bacterium]